MGAAFHWMAPDQTPARAQPAHRTERGRHPRLRWRPGDVVPAPWLQIIAHVRTHYLGPERRGGSPPAESPEPTVRPPSAVHLAGAGPCLIRSGIAAEDHHRRPAEDGRANPGNWPNSRSWRARRCFRPRMTALVRQRAQSDSAVSYNDAERCEGRLPTVMSVTRPPQPCFTAIARALMVTLTAVLALTCGSSPTSATDSTRQDSVTASAAQVAAQTDGPQLNTPAGKHHCGKKRALAPDAASYDNGQRGQAAAAENHVSSKPAEPQRLAGPFQGGPAPPAPDLNQLSILRI